MVPGKFFSTMHMSYPISTKLNIQLVLATLGLLNIGMPSSNAIPQVKLTPNDVVYISNEGSLTLICTVDQDVRIISVTFRRDGINYVGIFNPTIPQCNATKFLGDDTSVYTTSCDQGRNFTLLKRGTSADNHRKKWMCVMNSLAGGPCVGGNNPCLSQIVTSVLQVPVTTVQLMNGSGQTLSSSVNIVRGQSTGIRCSTAPSGSRPRATFQWYIRQGNQSPVLIVDQSVSSTPDPITVPGQPESDLLISYSTWTLTGNASYHNMYIYCQARDETNTGNYTKSDEVQLDILYPPVVLLSTYQSIYNVTAYQSTYNVTEGMQNFDFICNIIEANPLPQANSYSWFHGTSIIPGQTSSSYTLPSVQRSDAGEYKCTARNDYGTGTSNSLNLIVQYGAVIKDFIVQRGITVNENESATFQCSVDSYPKSTITLKRESDGTVLKTEVDALQSQYWLPSAHCLDTDNYTCSASNNISQPAVRTIHFFVKCHPRLDFRAPFVNVSYSKHLGDAVLRYTVISYPPPRFTWTFLGNGSESRGLPNSAIQSDYGQQSELRFTKLDIGDFGLYRVIADNAINPPATSVLWLVKAGTPGKPLNFHGTNVQEKQMSLRWQSGYNEGFTQTFVVEISLDNITWNNVSEVDSGNRDGWFSTIIGDLIPGSEYYLRLYAYNKNGRGDFADVQLAVRMLKEVGASTGIGVGGAVGIGVGGIVLGLIAAIIAFKIRRQLNGPTNSCFRSKGKTDEEMHEYSNTEMNPQTVKPIYEELNKENTERSVYDKISPLEG